MARTRYTANAKQYNGLDEMPPRAHAPLARCPQDKNDDGMPDVRAGLIRRKRTGNEKREVVSGN